ncbi:hypothetical protein MXB_2708, partial [Myxobolus squamalis]
RTGPGICFRVYSENDFLDFDEFPIPEIKRADLNSLVLQMLSLGLKDPLSFPFLEQPETAGINCALKDLRIRKAVSDNGEITLFGRGLAALPLEPSVGAILLYGSFLDMSSPSLIYVAALGIQTPFNSSFSGRVDFKDKSLGEISENFVSKSEGDPFLLIKAFNKWLSIKRSEKSRYSKIWCRKLGIIERRFYDMVQLCNQFKRLLNSLNFVKPDVLVHKINLSKTEVKELKDKKQEILNLPRKRKILNADFNFVNEDDGDFGELDVKDIEFRLGRSGSILGSLSTEDMPLEDHILFIVGLVQGLYPQYAIPDETVPVLLLTCNLDTDERCSKIVADSWLEIKFTRPHDALEVLCSAISIRNSFSELLDFYFSPEVKENFEYKMTLLRRMRSEIIEFFHRDLECTLKYIVNADRQLVMYRTSACDSSEIPADLLIVTGMDVENKVHPSKGGYCITPYLTFGCLVDTGREFVDQPYLKTHFTCPTCDIHMICTPGEQMAHSNNCKPVIPLNEDKTENDSKSDSPVLHRLSYTCEACNDTLMLTMTEILRHKNSHNLD